MQAEIQNPMHAIANQFDTAQITSIKTYGNGNVNDTYIAVSSDKTRYILQRVNTAIFTSPETVMSNMHATTKHLSHCIQNRGLTWKVQKVIPSKTKKNYYIHTDGTFWRMISFIEDAHSVDILDSHDKALELGKAVGLFHSLMAEIPHGTLSYALEGFHVVPQYLQTYDKILAQHTPLLNKETDYALRFIQKYREEAVLLETGKEHGILPLRVIHGDLKINNIMFSRADDRAISIIDLDTVQPGLIHYDIGDCMRSSCNRHGEETQAWEEVHFDSERLKYIWRGYLNHAHELMSEQEYAYIYDAIFAITFEIGLRFFTDYLAGNVYFKIHYPENNLFRALVQFRLAQSIHAQKETISQILIEEKAKYIQCATVRS